MTIQFSPGEAERLDISLPFYPERPGQLPRYVRNGVKRLLDLTLVLVSLPFVVPIILALAFIVALDGHRPFYRQDRVGRDGRVFRIWKLRSMVHDADARLEQYLSDNPEARAEWTRTQKLRHDPRVTRFGRILRRTSLDELPQLINVLSGSMSLVGPRPMMVSQRDAYHGRAYFRLRPGITGLWQISKRNECEFTGRVRYDEAYFHSVSLRTDILILFRTIGVVLRGTGC